MIVFQVFEVGDVEDDVDDGLAVGGAGFDVADVGFGVADDACDLFQHAVAVVAENGELDRVSSRGRFVAGPRDVDAALGLVHQVHDVWTIDGVDGDALAARDVADDGFAADRVTTSGTIDEQVALALDDDGVVVAAEDAAHDAADSRRARLSAFASSRAGGGARRAQAWPAPGGRNICRSRCPPSGRRAGPGRSRWPLAAVLRL